MAKRTLAVLAASLIVCAGAVTGCGGDDDGDGEAATTAAGSAPAGGGAERLDESQWQSYQTVATAFRDANQAAIKRVNRCEDTEGTSSAQFKTCVGDVIANVASASSELRATLDGFQGAVGGACEPARAAFSGYLTNYEATAKSLERTLSSGSTTGFDAGVQNIKTVAAAGAPARTTFESTCGPT